MSENNFNHQHNNQAQKYWQTNPKAALVNSNQWVSNLIIEKAINKRISGGETEKYWLAWLIEDFFAGRKFDNLLSIGCGVGNHEILIAKLGLAKNIDAFDFSKSALEIARIDAEKAGVKINFYQDNFNTFTLNKKYDLITCFGSLHHVKELEHCLSTIKNSLKPQGYVILNEYIGDCFNIYEQQQLDIINRIYNCFDDSLKSVKISKYKSPSIEKVFTVDPSEAVRSKLILAFIKYYFRIEVLNHYGGGLIHELYQLLDSNQFITEDPKGETIIKLLLEFEKILMEIPGGLKSDFCLCILRHKTLKKQSPKPEFLIIGAQQCGVNYLHKYLFKHSQIAAPKEPSLHFFDLNFYQGINWYQNQFVVGEESDLITGESSSYYLFHPLVPQRVYNLYPNIKLIVILRNPIDRAINHYYHEVKLGYESLSLSEAIAAESNRLKGEIEKIIETETYYSFNHQHYTYLSRGKYVEQLQNWMKFFPKEQFLILQSEDLFNHPQETMNKVFKFLDLKPELIDDHIDSNQEKEPDINSETYQQLTEYFQTYNQKLNEYIGIKFHKNIDHSINYQNPHFLIIGAQKCGTNSLYNYLVQHPLIAASLQHEIHYFDLNFDRDLKWYQSQFPQLESGIITGESSPYYLFHPLVPQRIFDIYPQMKLIILLRNPAERAISHYYHEVRLGTEKLTLKEAIAAEQTRLKGEVEKIIQTGTYYSFNHQHYTYLARGKYIEQLQNWMNIFPKEQFLILKSEDLFSHPQETMNKVFQFLELPAHFSEEYLQYNSGNYSQPNDEIYQHLIKYFQSDNQKLAEFLNIYLNWE
ncbi:sulfotransferase domain-containing protein [Okeania sp. SIO2B3]|uniref:sulfotransferase domain-containing protein n=1 Tax=Okeania sp. SIO2B3 TaxID=2607784 RepID=UPI0025E9BC87|nr:sulfotransferase domain-containing protein [Okeania sp. SIO2B3]